MMKSPKCPECGMSNLYATEEVSSGGGYAPNYLPGLGKFLSPPSFTIIVCKDCGLTRFFAAPKALERLSTAYDWQKVRLKLPSNEATE